MDLLPCPFCGNEHPTMMYTSLEAHPKEYWVRCSVTCVEQFGLYTFEKAVELWNTRK